MIRTFVLTTLSVMAAIALWGGCHKDPVSSIEPDVNNVRDNFHFRMSDVKNHDTAFVYYWQMDGASANIDQSASIKGGSVLITIEDDSRTLVYQTDMKQLGAFMTSSGAAGMWRIRISLTNFTGLIDFRAQRR